MRETGAHLWAERFEENVTDLFKLQDQVVARLANTLGYELVKAEAEKSMHSVPDAIDLTMRGRALLLTQLSDRVVNLKEVIFMRREPCLNRRSQSTPTMPTRWPATPPITYLLDLFLRVEH